MKEVLVLYYTQTGQLSEILEQITTELGTDEVQITYQQILPTKPFPFPWNDTEFYGAFPESFLQIPQSIEPLPTSVMEKKYDLVILGYQVWFLTPSIPINSFLKTTAAKKILDNTPVITVIGCRNMWVMAQEKMKRLLKDCNAKLVGNIALVDRNINHISVITIQ
ncbi:MAG: dialkylresorcinol condensing enzyme DarA, partial [Flavobacteriaceae bacterium]|nr:dialkylresorcinol condensing enzyme DarA [Flavobacteriaceae bacterium]